MKQRIDVSYSEYDADDDEYLIGLLSPLITPDHDEIRVDIFYTVNGEKKVRSLSTGALFFSDTGTAIAVHGSDLNITYNTPNVVFSHMEFQE